jgi:hypothetical protein
MEDEDVLVHCAVCNGWFAVGACACVFPPPVAVPDPYGPEDPEGDPEPPLFMQCLNGCPVGAMEALLATGVRVDQPGRIANMWITPLAMAAGGGDVRVVQLLLDHNADVHAHHGLIPHRVVRVGVLLQLGDRPAVMKLLLDHGANVNTTDALGFTPLHDAADTGDALMARMLIHHGGNKMARTNVGETVANVATRRNVGTGTHDAVLEVIQTETLPRAKGVAFAMGLHERLGEASRVKTLNKELLRMVLEDNNVID